MDLLTVQTTDEAFARAGAYLLSIWDGAAETVPLVDAVGRYLAQDVITQEDIPNFTRSAVDGYAVRAGDTRGASEGIPVLLDVVGTVVMGEAVTQQLAPGQAMYVPTGGMLPQQADAVVMIEYCDASLGDIVAIDRSVAVGDHVIRRGSDMTSGQVVLPRGRRINPYDIATLAAVGCADVPVYCRLKVSVFASGDEVIPVEATPAIGQVRNVNSYGNAALAERFGWQIQRRGHVPDDPDQFHDTLREACLDSHMVVISGGSSKGKKDYTAATFEALGAPGIFTHGLAIKPGKPTLLAGAHNTLLVGLPGHPVSAMVVFELLLRALETVLFSVAETVEEEAILAENISGTPGLARYVPGVLELHEDGIYVMPKHGKSGQISLLSDSDVLILLPRHAEGCRAGTRVRIRRLHV